MADDPRLLGNAALAARGPSWGGLPTLVALFVVFPLKHLPVGGGWKPDILVGALLLNGAWGAGVTLFMRLFGGAKGR